MYPTLIDASHAVHEHFNAEGLPIWVVIAGDGVVAGRVDPHTEENLLTVLGRAGLKER